MTRRLATPRKTRTESPLQVRLTHPDRVIFSEPDITKRDLASYYNQASEWILPHVADRPLSLVRCPAGTSGQCFFQKHPPEGLPAVVKRIEIREKEGVNTYLTISNVEGLVTLVQFGAIEIHAWSARVDDVDKPDRLIFDLDPDPAVDWPAVVEAALLFRRVFADLGLVAFVKTTGGKGLHVVIPVDRRRDWKTVKSFCKSTAKRVAAAAPAQYTTNPLKAHRRGKIFIDYLRNERGATAVAPYSCRARTGAPVATPVSWDELRSLSGPQEFTLANVPRRLSRKRRDPWADVTRVRQSLPSAGQGKGIM